AVGVDDPGLGDESGSVACGDLAVGVVCDDKVIGGDALIDEEGADAVGGFVDGDGEQAQFIGGEVALEFSNRGHFFAAGFAPCGPEVHQDPLSSEFVQGDGFTVESCEFEGDGGAAARFDVQLAEGA